MTEETVLYEDPRVKITNARAVIEGKTYPVANLASVGMSKQSPSGLLPMILFIIGGFMVLFNLQDIAQNIGNLITGAIILGLGFVVVRASKPTYILSLSTSAGEIKALQSDDQAYIQKLTDALNQAIIQRA